eukprot:SAG31_NODE_893_length_11177_cov_10.241806_12_plen_88_part_00
MMMSVLVTLTGKTIARSQIFRTVFVQSTTRGSKFLQFPWPSSLHHGMARWKVETRVLAHPPTEILFAFCFLLFSIASSNSSCTSIWR